MRLITFFLLISSLPLSAVASPQPILAKHAMVVSQHQLASNIGADVMKKGGNAVDAAIAVGLALAVVYPEAGNIGGGGFMLIRKPNGESFVIDYRETAPKAAHRDMYVDNQGEIIKDSSTIGYRGVGVPGTMAGFELAFKKFGSGKIKWRDLVRPARLLAQNGCVLSHRLAELFKEYKGTLEKFEDSKRIFLNGGKLFEEGDILRQPDLAKTLLRIERLGAKEFYTGTTAKLISDDMKANGGLITLDDLRDYKAKERTPLRGSYRGHEIISVPPPSSGGIVTLSILNILEGYDLRSMQHNSAAKFHVLAEAMRRAFADRAEFMGDPDFTGVPVTQLIDKKYAVQRRSTINMKRASSSRDVSYGEPTREPRETTHYSVVDPSGMVVANTYTINDYFGSRVTARGTGILLNDEMDDFTSQPGRENLYGLIQGERNAITGRKRPLSSMSPTIVLRRDGSVWFTLGARGGPRIITAVAQSMINVIDHEMDIQAAIDAPRIHHQWFPDEILYEPYGLSPDTMSILTGYGHKFGTKVEKLASVTAIMIDEKGVRLGAIDSRSDGAAVGW